MAVRPGAGEYLRKTRMLVVLGLVAVCYAIAMHGGTLTGSDRIDGSVGVLLGLYVCSHPAANGIDVLVFDRGALHRLSGRWAGVGWLLLNLFVLAAGWFIIVVGAGRVSQPPA